MKLEIITPESTFYSGEVDSVTLPGTMGSFQILKNHAPIISSLKKGILSFMADGHNRAMEVEDGFVEVNNNMITVCIDSVKGR